MLVPIKMSGETIENAETLLLRLIDENGNVGWGEASAAPLMTGETLASLTASTQYLATKIIGLPIDDLAQVHKIHDRILYGNSSAKSCVEIALVDLLSQRREVPMYQMLTETAVAPDMRLEMMHMLAHGDIEREIEEARLLRSQGYRHWKIKIGVARVEVDARRIRMLCRELQGDIISADANQALSVVDAAALATVGVESGLTFLEQPLSIGMKDEMAALHATTGMALCVDESVQDVQDAIEHHVHHAAQGVSLKLIKFGGPRLLFEAGSTCLSLGLRLNLACKIAETTISAAATAHVGIALKSVDWGFSMSNRYLKEDVCEDSLTPIKGGITANQLQRPGLGFVPEVERLDEFASASVPRVEIDF